MSSNTFWIFVLSLLPLLGPTFPSSATAGGMSSYDMLVDIEWQWKKTSYSNDTEAVPGNPERYSITFREEGSFFGLADCNRIRGSYSLSGGQIVIGPITSTRAMCPPDSLDRVFLKDLERAVIIFFKGDRLYIDLKLHSGTMVFLPVRGERAEKPDVGEVETVICRDPRPQACTMEYDPVCGERKDSTSKTYSNGCQACSDSQVIHYRNGECP